MTTKALEKLLLEQLGKENTPKELAEKLKVSKSTIYNLVKEKKLLKKGKKIDTLSLFNCLR